MTTLLLHLPSRFRLISWAQIEFGLFAAMCALGYASALVLALG